MAISICLNLNTDSLGPPTLEINDLKKKVCWLDYVICLLQAVSMDFADDQFELEQVSGGLPSLMI